MIKNFLDLFLSAFSAFSISSLAYGCCCWCCILHSAWGNLQLKCINQSFIKSINQFMYSSRFFSYLTSPFSLSFVLWPLFCCLAWESVLPVFDWLPLITHFFPRGLALFSYILFFWFFAAFRKFICFAFGSWVGFDESVRVADGKLWSCLAFVIGRGLGELTKIWKSIKEEPWIIYFDFK